MAKKRDFQPESYSLTRLREVMKKRSEFESPAGNNRWIFEELINYLMYSAPRPWVKEEGEEIIGEVWEQYLGTVCYKHKKHIFTCLYVANDGLAVANHGHLEIMPTGEIKKTREFYVFPNGDIEYCGKDMRHELVNNYGEPIYVISVKATGRGHRTEVLE